MTGIERLRKLSEDLLPYRLWNVLFAGTEEDWDCQESDFVTVSDVLSAIADQIEREHNVSDREEHEAAVWMREHGGLDHVRAEWSSRVPRDLYERRRQSLLGHIAECETALGRRNVRIEELGHRVSDLTNENAELRKRAMPEGCEWPTVDGRKVDFKTQYQPSLGVLEAVSIYSNGACEVMSHDGIIKPVSEIHVVVLAAGGEELEVFADGEAVHVSGSVQCREKGTGHRYTCYPQPSQLTHTKPEPRDSWERIEEDALSFVEDNAGIPHDQDQMERDMLAILRRCKALAERSE